MRITRSGLRRIIAEESARILAEANDERVPGGHLMRMAAGFEDEPAEVDFEDEDLGEEAARGEKVLHVLSLGRGLRFVVADDIDVDIDEDEGVEDVTEEIVDAEGESSPESLLSWLEAHPEVGVVHDDDYEMSENDASAYMEELRRLIELGASEDDGFDDGGEGYDDGGDEYLEEGDGGDYDYEDEPEAEMGDPEDPYGDLPKGEHPRGGLVHTAGFKGDSPAKALLRRREEFPEHPSGLTGMGGPYSEYDHLHYGAGINEARWAKLAGVLKD